MTGKNNDQATLAQFEKWRGTAEHRLLELRFLGNRRGVKMTKNGAHSGEQKAVRHLDGLGPEVPNRQ